MSNANFHLGRYLVNGQTVIGRRAGDSIDVVCENDDLPLVLSNPPSDFPAKRRLAAADVQLLAPLDARARVFAIAINYHAHGAEAKAQPPERPLMFYKAPSNFVGHGGTLNPNRQLTAKFDYEGEIAVVIGRTCKNATIDNALDFVAGVCAFDDGSARDISKVALGQAGPTATYWPDWTANKGLDGGSALGPTIACGPDILAQLRARSLHITTRLNGEQVQSESMREMIFSTEQIIATLSSYMTLLPGDVIATGTPAGVGVARNRFLATGDTLEIEVSGLDTLRVTVG
ncbi:fumarylacetoacetate hydrolase family protein [Pantoea sp. 18069]|uniref:fumarylacetoacetate hydrolase family protein n=1 Tax=Pantoea sp. 18069 TaxID=2681415 RepID=UPI0013581688|nr:fumarylacetoacetate hydrolase family protein [Pantoea sp. 18069]